MPEPLELPPGIYTSSWWGSWGSSISKQKKSIQVFQPRGIQFNKSGHDPKENIKKTSGLTGRIRQEKKGLLLYPFCLVEVGSPV